MPGERTVARILKRANKVRARRKHRPTDVVERAPQEPADAPNDVWTADFKGWWRAANGTRCEPLTVRDAFSRYVLGIVLCRARTTDGRAVFERLFRKYGLPSVIQCDNGVPFVSVRAVAGISALSAWWMSMGIRLVRSRPGCPQDNGGHERMHRDISADVQFEPAETLEAQQRILERWQQQFNHVRPHQALGGKTPAELYTPSPRKFLGPQPYEYPEHFRVYRVTNRGMIYVRRVQYFVSASLTGYEVALEPVDACHVRVWFRSLDLGVIEIEPEVDDDFFEERLRSRSSGAAA